MTAELDILKIVAENPDISQRKIAEKTGTSLGQVNLLIQKCVKKGLIKIEGQTAKSIKYNLTPKGFAEKAALTLQYIKISYDAIISLTEKIKATADQYARAGEKIYICGEGDEMMSIMKLALGSVSLLEKPVKNAVIFYWDSEQLEQKISELQLVDCKYVNILK